MINYLFYYLLPSFRFSEFFMSVMKYYDDGIIGVNKQSSSSWKKSILTNKWNLIKVFRKINDFCGEMVAKIVNENESQIQNKKEIKINNIILRQTAIVRDDNDKIIQYLTPYVQNKQFAANHIMQMLCEAHKNAIKTGVKISVELKNNIYDRKIMMAKDRKITDDDWLSQNTLYYKPPPQQHKYEKQYFYNNRNNRNRSPPYKPNRPFKPFKPKPTGNINKPPILTKKLRVIDMKKLIAQTLKPFGGNIECDDESNCVFFNGNNQCTNSNCTRNHVCLLCKSKDHWLQKCPSILQFQKSD